jgi:hypothetical protein
MDRPHETTGEPAEGVNEAMATAALKYLKLGFRPIPLPFGSKGKGMQLKWKRYQTEMPTEAEIVEWFGSGLWNVALVTGNGGTDHGVVVVDVDDPLLLDQVIEHCGDTPMRTQTPRGGVHLWYRMRAGVHYGNAVKSKGRAVDLRAEGAYAVVPWSRNEAGVPYRWLGPVLPAEELPLLKVSWLRERKRPKPLAVPEEILAMTRDQTRAHVRGSFNGERLPVGRGRIRSPEGYVMRIGSVQGDNGSKALVRCVCVFRDAGRTPQQAFDYLWRVWNPAKAMPPWSEDEIWYAIRRHYGIR